MTKQNNPVSTLNDFHPSVCPHVQAIRLEYADWKWCYDKGYICYSRKSKKLQEHRLVAARIHGKLRRGLHVHHVNGQPTDNRAENLQVLTHSEHMKVHAPTGENVAVDCHQCGKTFTRLKSQVERRSKSFCSVECQRASQRKTSRPTKMQLAQTLADVNNFRAVGEMFGVSDNAVRKWAKQYGLNTKVVSGHRAGSVAVESVLGM